MTIGAGGEIVLGKEFAGQHVLVTQSRTGVWQVETADVIPHSQRFWFRPDIDKHMQEALAEVKARPVQVTSDQEMEALFAKALQRFEEPHS